MDGAYQRIKVTNDKTKYEIAKDLKDTEHTLLLCKATEAMIGYVDFAGIQCGEIIPLNKVYTRKIEFIGNSITSGTGLDLSEIPCDKGVWHDQHNAYLAYGPVTARALNANWLLSSVSGMGMSRNWNNEGPAFPQVYDHLYLEVNSKVEWNANTYIPDLVSICLGTNDFSDGDGSYDRKQLDSAKFVSTYIGFVKHIRERYPKAQICLLTSPAIDQKNNVKLSAYLSAVIKYMQEAENDPNVHKFAYVHKYSGGCGGHPNKEEHQKMSDELVPFFKKIMNW
jgi:lysophospholipase L1-like esterase